MCEGHVRVLSEIRTILKELQPTLKKLREIENKNAHSARLNARRQRDRYSAEVATVVGMCEELSELLWFEGREK